MKYIIILLVLFGLFSCIERTGNLDKSIKNIKKVFPKSDVYKSAEGETTFIVVDSTGVKYIQVYYSNSQIYNIEYLIKVN